MAEEKRPDEGKQEDTEGHGIWPRPREDQSSDDTEGHRLTEDQTGDDVVGHGRGPRPT